MIERNKRLIAFAVITLLFLGGYTLFIDNSYFGIGEMTYPPITEEDAAKIVADRIAGEQDFEIDPDTLVAELYVNAPVERFLDENGLMKEYATAERTPPISMWKVSFIDWDTEIETSYFVDLMSGDIIGFLDTTYYNEDFQTAEASGKTIAQRWLLEQGWADDFTYITEKTNKEGVDIHHFISKNPVAGDIPLLLKVYTFDGWFAGFYPKLDIPDTYVPTPFITGLSNSLAIISTFGYLALIFIVGLIFWAMRATERSLTIAIPLISGISLFVIGALMMTSVDGILEGLLNGWFVFMAMMAVYSKRDQLGNRSLRRISYLREKVLQGYMFGIIAFVPSFFFYTIAENMFDAWGSGQDAFLLLKDAQWIMLTPFLIGAFAAISEEIMYRKFGEFVFKRVWNNQVFIALVTSLIWAVAHLGYTVHPWYLRIVELTFFIGPFFYWLYKKYGLTVAMIAHYLFDCFLVSLTLMSFDAGRYVYSLLFLLVPLLICLIPAKRHTSVQRPAAVDIKQT